MSKLSLQQVDFNHTPSLTEFKDHNVFQTLEWLRFVSLTQNAEPILAVVYDGNNLVGRFTGLVIKKYGFRILGSPFPGWTTDYMGFNLHPSVSRIKALNALEEFAFRKLNCIHLEIRDRYLRTSDFEEAGYHFNNQKSFEIDLTQEEAILYSSMKPSCRYSIRKANKMGVCIEIASDLSFADDYYAQLEDVFAKQNLISTYPIERVRSLIEHLHPTGHLLLVRARDGQGKCIATGIFPALNDTMYFWGGASWRQYQFLQPNEPIQWFAMLYWKARGITKCDMGGGGEYKRKYGGYDISVPWGRKSKYSFLEPLRNAGKIAFALKQRVLGVNKH